MNFLSSNIQREEHSLKLNTENFKANKKLVLKSLFWNALPQKSESMKLYISRKIILGSRFLL